MNKYFFLLIISLILSIGIVNASSGSYNWNFTTPSDYIYNTTEIIVTGGNAQLNGTTTTPHVWFHLNELSGITIGDSSGNNFNGIGIPNATWVTGKLNNALQFNGATQYVNFTNSSTGNFERTEAHSYEFWVKTSVAPTNSPVIMGKIDYVGYRGWYIFEDNFGGVDFIEITSLTNYLHIKTTTATINNNLWRYVVVTYDGTSSASGVKIYIDGVNQNLTTTKNNLEGTIITSESFKIGRDNVGAYFNGVLDEIVIHNKVLSQSDVNYRYNSGAGTENSLGAYQTEYYSIQPKNNFSFSTALNLFNETATKTGSEIKYSVTTDGSWKYWDGSSWVTSNGNWTQSNSASDVNSHINTLGSSGNFTFRAILHSTDGTYTPYLDNIFTLYDGDAPIVSNLNSTPADTTATITWTTNEGANSTINYGSTLALGSSSSNSSFVTSHSALLTGLSTSTLYYYNITSCDSYENCVVNGTYNFTTISPTPPIISGVSASSQAFNSTITWTTDLSSNSTVCYWITGYSEYCEDDVSLVTSHNVFITGLTENTWYNYYVRSCTSLCSQSSNYTFKTTFSYSNASTTASVYVKDNQIFKRDDSGINLTAICYASGNTFCNGLTDCKLSVMSNGNTLLDNVLMDWNTNYYSYSATTLTTIGDYSGTVTCTGINIAYTNFDFKITPSGNISTSGEAIVYIILILVILFFFVLCLIGAIKIESGNYYDVGGNLMKLNYGKYLKMGLFWLSIVILWFLFYLGWEVSNKVLMFNFVGDIFHTLFMILTYLLAPSFIAFTIFAIVQWTGDLKLWELAKRGLQPR